MTRKLPSLQERQKLHGIEYAATYDKVHSPRRLTRLLPFIALKNSDDALDIGCGIGGLMPYVAPAVRTYTGIDFSEPMIEAAKKRAASLRFENARFYSSSVQSFCQEHKAEFDVCFAMDVSEHVPDQEWIAVLRSVHLALRSGARLYLHTPNADYVLEIMKKHNFVLRQFPHHVAVRTRSENERMLTDAGFNIPRSLVIPHYNVMRLLHPLKYIPYLGKYFGARLFIEATA